MIFGTGIDIIEIDRIRNSLEKYSERFEEKVFTTKEIGYCRSRPEPAIHFAARFAAKEAVLKSMGTGMSQGISWRDMEIGHCPDLGKPVLEIRGKLLTLFEEQGLKAIHISLSHEKGYAIAQAIAEQ